MVLNTVGIRKKIGKFAIGIDLGGTKISAALVNYNGDSREYIKSPTNAQQGKDILIDRIKQTIHQLVEKS